MIQFDMVSKTYPNGVHAVSDLLLDVLDGETLVLLGTSGSGKTTTMKMVNRLIEPTNGSIRIDGVNVMRHEPTALRRSIGCPDCSSGTRNESIRALMISWDLSDLSPNHFGDAIPMN